MDYYRCVLPVILEQKLCLACRGLLGDSSSESDEEDDATAAAVDIESDEVNSLV